MTLIDKIKTISKNQEPVYLITGKNDYWENEVMKQIKKIIPEEEQTMNLWQLMMLSRFHFLEKND